jgi:hypothetical protein
MNGVDRWKWGVCQATGTKLWLTSSWSGELLHLTLVVGYTDFSWLASVPPNKAPVRPWLRTSTSLKSFFQLTLHNVSYWTLSTNHLDNKMKWCVCVCVCVGVCLYMWVCVCVCVFCGTITVANVNVQKVETEAWSSSNNFRITWDVPCHIKHQVSPWIGAYPPLYYLLSAMHAGLQKKEYNVTTRWQVSDKWNWRSVCITIKKWPWSSAWR